MTTKLEIDKQEHSIVLVGSLNHTIFQPLWFASKNLLSQSDADNAKINILIPELIDFSLEWLHVQVTNERFIAQCRDERMFGALRDLVMGTFQILAETPLTKLGVNLVSHINVPTKERWNALGDKLAPKNLWSDILNNPGMTNLQIRGQQRPDEYQGFINVNVTPSPQDPDKKVWGVLVQVNDHYELNDSGKVIGAKGMTSILNNQWKASLDRSRIITNKIMELA